MKFDRSLPYFNALLKAPNNRRIEILQSFPTFVVNDLIEVLYNVVLGNVDVGRRKTNMKKYKKSLIQLVSVKGKKNRRNVIYNQRGGFIGALIPIVLSVLGGALGNAMA